MSTFPENEGVRSPACDGDERWSANAPPTATSTAADDPAHQGEHAPGDEVGPQARQRGEVGGHVAHRNTRGFTTCVGRPLA
jgi:hypothetical protein